MKNVTRIAFPNTVKDDDKTWYSTGKYVDEIIYFTKNGEMASIGWFSIVKDNKVIAEIKESVCDVYGVDELTK